MAFGIFVHRADSIYDDRPDQQYQFPVQYLERARACRGDWVIYYEPVKAQGTRGYFAVARVQDIIPDPKIPRMFLAIIEPGSYLEFPNPVPFRGVNGPAEQDISGRAQWSVRPLSLQDFNRIIDAGLNDTDILSRTDSPDSNVLAEDRAIFESFPARERMAVYGTRAVRDRIFRKSVLFAYDSRCALTGLKLINGGGRAEVEAAHIRPVEADGPDRVSNGLALSGTVHWMFDRGLITLEDDLKILISRHVNDQQSIETLLNKTGYARLPLRAADQTSSTIFEVASRPAF